MSDNKKPDRGGLYTGDASNSDYCLVWPYDPMTIKGAGGTETMTITTEQQTALLEAAKPLMLWLEANCHPHCEVRVNAYDAELTEGIAMVKP